MEFIIEYYKELETLDLIIFWGIIIVIILLLIFSLIMINKNRKLKNLVNQNKYENNKYESNEYEELPVKKEKNEQIELLKNNQNLKENLISKDIQSEQHYMPLPEIPEINQNNNLKNTTDISIETEKKFIAEEHVMEYNKNYTSIHNIKKENETQEEKVSVPQKNKKTIEMPSGPYQRNVLREMSLSQTSPIGLTIPKKTDNQKMELAKDLEASLNEKNVENILSSNDQPQSIIKETIKNESIEHNQQLQNSNNNQYRNLKEEEKKYQEIRSYQKIKNYQDENNIIKKELKSIENPSSRKTAIINEPKNEISSKTTDYLQRNRYIYDERSKEDSMKKRIKYEEQINNLEKKHELSNSPSKGEKSEKINKFHDTKDEPQKKYQETRINQQENTVHKQDMKQLGEEISQNNIDPRVKELLNSVSLPLEAEKKKNSSEKYLEEVSRKLAEAEIQDEIERTDYELEQEENAIISYKELMEKKDSIQTIDEEEAVISIEELLNRNNQKQESIDTSENTKLYKLTEEEENEDFIKELKQFRNDL